jgi:hypothetical protein
VAAQPIWQYFESEQAQSNAFAAQTNETSFLQAPKGAAEKHSWNCNANVLLGTCGAECGLKKHCFFKRKPMRLLSYKPERRRKKDSRNWQKTDICRPKDDKFQ